jgi:hypothetical protein
VARFTWEVAGALARRTGPLDRVLDPAAGAGVFLQLAQADGLAPIGIEVDPGLAERTAVSSGARVLCGDALRQRFPEAPEGSFDLVIGNPPFGRLGTFPGFDAADPAWEVFEVLEAGGQRGRVHQRRRGFPIDQLFLERALALVRPGGVIAFVMPEGFLANDRHQPVRDWTADRAAVLGSVCLPPGAFTWPGLNARVAVIFLRRRDSREPRRAVLVRPPLDRRPPLDAYLQDAALAVLGRSGAATPTALIFRLAPRRLAGHRWDAGFWLGRRAARSSTGGRPWARLGDYIEHLTYGPIVTGTRAVHQEGGVRVIRQGDFGETGLRGGPVLRVAPGGPFDPERSRVRSRDLLLPRSGAGALGKNRVAVYLDLEPANVGCFVDLVRLRELNPFFLWLFLRAGPGWQQVQQVINGVGTPNLSFAEIRSLRVPLLSPEEQGTFELRYLDEVLPWHRRGEETEAIRRFRTVVADLERRLIAT